MQQPWQFVAPPESARPAASPGHLARLTSLVDIRSNAMRRELKLYLKTVGLGGLLRAVRAKFTGLPGYHTLTRHDCRHAFRLRVPSSDVPTYRQVFVDGEYDFLVAAQPQVIVDAGANIGLASIYFANKYPEAQILAIEPEHGNFQLLRQNVAAYPNVIPIHAALWNSNEEINLTDPGLGNWGFMTEAKNACVNPPDRAGHAVSARTVDSLMEEFGISKIDILKIDIEGAEKEVFADTTAWIAAVNSIIIELHERMKAGCNRSFYCGSNGFDDEWIQGENVVLSRNGYLQRAA